MFYRVLTTPTALVVQPSWLHVCRLSSILRRGLRPLFEPEPEAQPQSRRQTEGASRPPQEACKPALSVAEGMHAPQGPTRWRSRF